MELGGYSGCGWGGGWDEDGEGDGERMTDGETSVLGSNRCERRE